MNEPVKKWRIWFTAYLQNYKGSGIFAPEIVAEQAWNAGMAEVANERDRALKALAAIRNKTLVWQQVKAGQTLKECHRIAHAALKERDEDRNAPYSR